MTEESPDRDLGGGNIRLAHLFEALAGSLETHLLAIGRVDDERVQAAAASVTTLAKPRVWHPRGPLTRRFATLALALLWREPATTYDVRRARRALASALHDRRDQLDLVLVEQEALAPLLDRRDGSVWAITFQHVLSVMAAQLEKHASGRRQRWLHRRDREKALRLECWAMHSYDVVIVCSPEDGEYLERMAGGDHRARIVVVPNGVDADRYTATPVPVAPRILLPGTLTFAPNVYGAVWFCHEVLPLVRDRVPETTLEIVGRDPHPDVLALDHLPGVRVRPNVPSMVPYFRATRAVVVPVRIGSGTRLKALEALASGRPVVGTSVGLEGLGLIHGEHALIADVPEAMADAVTQVLTCDDLARGLAERGRDHVAACYGWERIGEQFVQELLMSAPQR